MPLAVKLDEDLPKSLGADLIARGYPVATVRDQGWGGMNDDELWLRVSAEGRFFITSDKEFGDIRRHPPGSHPGILLLRPDRQGVLELRALLSSALEGPGLEALAGTVSVATNRALRVRRP